MKMSTCLLRVGPREDRGAGARSQRTEPGRWRTAEKVFRADRCRGAERAGQGRVMAVLAPPGAAVVLPA